MKTSTKPCVKCGTPEGRLRCDGGGPVRYRGERFGIAGVLCAACRATQMRRARQLGITVEKPPRDLLTLEQEAEIQASIEAERARRRESCPAIESFQKINAARAARERTKVTAERRDAMRQLAIGA